MHTAPSVSAGCPQRRAGGGSAAQALPWQRTWLPCPGRLTAEVVVVNAKDVLGMQGENIAAEYLKSQGIEIIERNWRCSEGEIDIVARDGRALVVCEVKTRSGLGRGGPLESVSRQKRSRLRRLAIRWVAANAVLYDEIRIDVIGVLRTPQGSFTVEHAPAVG
jgi:putative endonuclease